MTESDNPEEPEASGGFLIVVGGVRVREIDETNLMRWRWADPDGNHEIVWVRHPSVVFHSVQPPHQHTWRVHTLAGDPGDGQPTPRTAVDARAMTRRFLRRRGLG